MLEQEGVLSKALFDFYRCPPNRLRFALAGKLSEDEGFFRFGNECICYGRSTNGTAKSTPDQQLDNLYSRAEIKSGEAVLPFDPDEIIRNLHVEHYSKSEQLTSAAEHLLKRIYYVFRPYLGLKARRAVQRFRARNWSKVPFPKWPVDTTVENLAEQLLLLSMRAQGVDRVPFIWFWPKGAQACVTMTHDVETQHGVEHSKELMDLNDLFGIKAAFDIVPEERYAVPTSYLESIHNRGFEVCVQDLNHDGLLFENKKRFLQRIDKINDYGRLFGASGFRAAVLYRNPDWFPLLNFSFDMSIPNVAHLDPQSGGCCTVMPYFIGNLLELPVTTVQDYTLYHILGDDTIDVWKKQTETIIAKHGLASFIVHPDYITDQRLGEMYRELLGYLTHLREERNLWIAMPSEIDRWWRARSQMTVVSENNCDKIVGVGSEDAVLAYAVERGGELQYDFCPSASPEVLPSVDY